MNCILIELAELQQERRVFLSGPRLQHIQRVLKKGLGDSLRIGLVNGPLGRAEIVDLDEQRAELACEWDQVPPVPPHELLLAMPRPKVLRRLWAQFASLGLRRIHLVNAQRVERYYWDSHVVQPETYRPLLLEGLQQSVDTHVPEVLIHRAFRPFVEDQLPDMRRLCLDPSGSKPLAPAALPTLLAIGPEGGWVDFERELLARQHFEMRQLGGRILRSDTACIVALARLSG